MGNYLLTFAISSGIEFSMIDGLAVINKKRIEFNFGAITSNDLRQKEHSDWSRKVLVFMAIVTAAICFFAR